MSQNPIGYYLYCYKDLSDSANAKSGVDKKILSQIKVFNDNGFKCEFKYCPAPKNFFTKAFSCLPFFSDGIKWPKANEVRGASFLYIRRPVMVSKELIYFLANFREENPEALILYEIPSYPYDGEMSGISTFALIKDRLYRKKLKKYVDYVVDLSGNSAIFGIPTVKFFNGIDLDAINIRKPKKTNNNAIHILSVSFFEPWHGIDRFIEGLNQYRKSSTRSVYLHLVGAGTDLPHLKELTNRYHLNNAITFHGVLSGDELDKVYNLCSLGIECLGMHRKGINQVSSSLKSREYLAKGLPFFGSSEIDVFKDEPFSYYLKVPANETPVDVKQVIKFYDSIYSNRKEEEVINDIRKYAERHISMDVSMDEILAILSKRINIE